MNANAGLVVLQKILPERNLIQAFTKKKSIILHKRSFLNVVFNVENRFLYFPVDYRQRKWPLTEWVALTKRKGYPKLNYPGIICKFVVPHHIFQTTELQYALLSKRSHTVKRQTMKGGPQNGLYLKIIWNPSFAQLIFLLLIALTFECMKVIKLLRASLHWKEVIFVC